MVVCTLPKTNSSHLKIGHPKRKLVFREGTGFCWCWLVRIATELYHKHSETFWMVQIAVDLIFFFWDGFGGQNLQQPMDIQNYTHVFWTISQVERHRGFWDVAYIWSSGVYLTINPYMCLWLPHVATWCFFNTTLFLDVSNDSVLPLLWPRDDFVVVWYVCEIASFCSPLLNLRICTKYVFNIIMLKPVQPSSG